MFHEERKVSAVPGKEKKSFLRHIRFLPPRFEHQSPVGEGEADLSKPDPHGAGHDVGCRVENDRLEDKCFCIGEQTKVSILPTKIFIRR